MSQQSEMTTRISEAALAKLDWRWSSGDISAYAAIAPTCGDWGATVRVSDHRQKPGGGFDEKSGSRRGDVELDFWCHNGKWSAFVGFNRDGRVVQFGAGMPTLDEIWQLLREMRNACL